MEMHKWTIEIQLKWAKEKKNWRQSGIAFKRNKKKMNFINYLHKSKKEIRKKATTMYVLYSVYDS